MDVLASVVAVLLAYLLGSVSFAVVVSRVMGLADPRTYGSKNPGATNVLRTGNKAAAVTAAPRRRKMLGAPATSARQNFVRASFEATKFRSSPVNPTGAPGTFNVQVTTPFSSFTS